MPHQLQKNQYQLEAYLQEGTRKLTLISKVGRRKDNNRPGESSETEQQRMRGTGRARGDELRSGHGLGEAVVNKTIPQVPIFHQLTHTASACGCGSCFMLMMLHRLSFISSFYRPKHRTPKSVPRPHSKRRLLFHALPSCFLHSLVVFQNGQSKMLNYIMECTSFFCFPNHQSERSRKHYGKSVGSNSHKRMLLHYIWTQPIKVMAHSEKMNCIRYIFIFI